MMIVPDKDVEYALEILANEEGAAARAASEYMDALTKTILAEIMGECHNDMSMVAKETWARAQPRFAEHLKKVREISERDYRWRRRYEAASAKIEAWRTENANQRAAERVR